MLDTGICKNAFKPPVSREHAAGEFQGFILGITVFGNRRREGRNADLQWGERLASVSALGTCFSMSGLTKRYGIEYQVDLEPTGQHVISIL